jgi:hypothetical protein
MDGDEVLAARQREAVTSFGPQERQRHISAIDLKTRGFAVDQCQST